jgi:hypothetical protein
MTKENITNKVMRNQKNITDRKQLKAFFKKGNLPSESAFEKLIDSTFNIADDKLDITKDGLMVYPSENGKEKLLSFFEDRDDSHATWVMFISNKEEGGISVNQLVQSENENHSTDETVNPPALFIQKDTGKIGLGTDLPAQKLEVDGLVASNGRMGTFHSGKVPADGEWHNIFDSEVGLRGCHAYEVMAYAEGKKNEGRYSLMHAIAISTLGNSRPKITKTSAYHGQWWNKIDVRWESRPSRIAKKDDGEKIKWFSFSKWLERFFEQRNPEKYNLQIRTKSKYGKDINLYFRVSVLWQSDFIKDI